MLSIDLPSKLHIFPFGSRDMIMRFGFLFAVRYFPCAFYNIALEVRKLLQNFCFHSAEVVLLEWK